MRVRPLPAVSQDGLRLLASALGIELEWFDISGVRNRVGLESLCALVRAMGFDPGDPISGLHEIERGRRARSVPTALVCVRGRGDRIAPLYSGGATWRIEEEETGRVYTGRLPADQEGSVAGRYIELPLDLADGYHQLTIEDRDRLCRSLLVRAPARCYGPSAGLIARRRWWGVTAQLYSLRSESDDGVGNFSELARVAALLGNAGAAAVGLSPVHALFPAAPQHASPYSPSSRVGVNWAYINTRDAPGYEPLPEEMVARLADSGNTTGLADASSASLVDWPAVISRKLDVLEVVFANFQKSNPPGSPMWQSLEQFIKNGGETLENFALFDALQVESFRNGYRSWSWRQWPSSFRHPSAEGVRCFRVDQPEAILFHLWLQWVADRQLAAAAAAARTAGMDIGLYTDMAVAEHPDGASTWSDPDLYPADVSVGSPPDPFNWAGQNWGLAPLSPHLLRERGYAPFISAIRTAMRHAGAMRIDHVMGLSRLFWIPAGADARFGAFVRYPINDLLGLVALESRRADCLVVGEDLGTVPAGFRPRLTEAGVLTFRVLWFERERDQGFARPETFPSDALATVSTHDLPTLAGWWIGRDLAWKQRLGLYADESARLAEGHERYLDRWRLLEVLVAQGLLPGPVDRNAEQPPFTPALAAAIHESVLRSPALLAMMQLEDLSGVEEATNIPGSVDEHPNWRRRLPAPAELLLEQPPARAILEAAQRQRPPAIAP